MAKSNTGILKWLFRHSPFARKLPWLEDAPEEKDPPLNSFSVEEVQSAQSLFQEALQLKDAGDDEAAIERYSDALAVVPVFWEALDNRGLAKMRLGDTEGAILDFERSARIAPDSDLAPRALITCYKRMKQWRKAYYAKKECRRRWPAKLPGR